jgi:hypothetical protein
VNPGARVDATRRQLRPLAGRFHVADTEAAFTAYEALSERRASEGKPAMFAFPHGRGDPEVPYSFLMPLGRGARGTYRAANVLYGVIAESSRKSTL